MDELCFGPEGVEMTLSDLRLDYPEPEVLAKMPLKKVLVSYSAHRHEKAARQLLSKGNSWVLPERHPPTQFAKSLHIESLRLNS